MQLSKYQGYTVRFDNRGTGFWIGENTIISCYHLFRDEPYTIYATYFPDTSFISEENTSNEVNLICKMIHPDPYLDLALFEVIDQESLLPHPVVSFNDDIEFGDRLETFSYPQGVLWGKSSDHSFGGRLCTKQDLLQIAFAGSPVLHGASGSPLFNRRTGKVCGLITSSIEEGTTGYNTIEAYGISSKSISLYCKKHKIFFTYEEVILISAGNFSTLIGSALQASHLLKKRALQKYNYNPDIYIERGPVDNKLRQNFHNKKNTILIGKSLAGKSRAIFHNLKNYEPDAQVFILNDHEDINKDLLLEVRGITIEPDTSAFFVINDIDEYLENPHFNSALDYLLSLENIVILATCKKSKLAYFESSYQIYLDYFKKIEILPIDNRTKKELMSKLEKLDEELIVDDTIGSFFIRLNYMITNYANLDLYSQEFLRSYKCTDIFLGKNKGNIEKIKDYTEKRLLHYHDEEKWKLSRKQIDQIISSLEKEGFLTYNNDDLIKVEDAYVERIIAQNESELRLIKEIIEYYQDIETYTKVISRASTKDLALYVFEILKGKNIAIESFAYNALISRENTFKEANQAFRRLLATEKEFQPDVITINTLIAKANDSETAYTGYQIFNEFNNLSPDAITYFTLFGKMRNASYSYLTKIREELEKNHQKVPQALYNQLIYKSNNAKIAFKHYTELQQFYMPDEATIMGLLKNADGYYDVLVVFLDAKQFGITIDEQFITSSANRIKEFIGVLAYCNLLIHYGYSLPSYTIKILLDLSIDFKEALTTFEGFPKDRITLSTTVFNALIRKAEKFEDGMSAIHMMEKAGITPSKNSYNSLMRIATRKQALLIYEEAFNNKLTPDAHTFYHLISSSQNFNEAAEFYQKAINLGLKGKIDLPFFNILFKQAKYESDSLQCFEILRDNNQIRPEPETLWLMINKSRNFENSVSMLDYAIANEYDISTTIINTILKNAHDEDQAKVVFEKMQSINLTPSLKNFSLLIKLTKPINRAWEIYDKIVELGYKPDAFTFSYLMDHTQNIADAHDVFDEFLNGGGITNTNYNRDKNIIDSFMIKYFNKIRNLDDCIDAYNDYRKLGGVGSINILNNILKFKRDKNDSNLVFEIIEAEELDYNVDTYSFILEESQSLTDAWKLLQEMELKGVYPNTRCGNFFIKKSKDYNEAFDWFTFIFTKYRLLPDKYTFIFFSKQSKGSRYYLEDLVYHYNISDDRYLEDLFQLKGESFEDKALNWLLSKLDNES